MDDPMITCDEIIESYNKETKTIPTNFNDKKVISKCKLSILDPCLWPEGSYELGSILPSFCPSVFLSRSFLGIGSLVFLETYHGVRGPCLVLRDRARIFLKNLFAPKMGKMGQKEFFEFIGKFGH